MPQLSVAECEKYLRGEIKRIDDIDPSRKNNADYFKRNVLLYSWLLQAEELSVNKAKLASLVGVDIQELPDMLQDLDQFFPKITDSALVLSSEMEETVKKVFDDPLLNYQITSPLPHFGDIRGSEFLEYINLLKTPYQMSLPSLVMNAFRSAVPNTKMEMPFSNLPHIRHVIGPNDKWQFILAVITHPGMLGETEVAKLKDDLSDIRDFLRDFGHGDLETLVIAPGVDDSARERMGRNRHIHFLWALSTLRFFNQFEKLRQGYDSQEQKWLAEEFSVVFDVEKASTIFSIRDALTRLDKAIKAKKNRA